MKFTPYYLQLLADEDPDMGEEAHDDAQEGGTDAAVDTKSDTEEAKYTNADVNKIIDEKFAKWKEQEQRRISEAKKLAEMSAAEKVQYERDEMAKELEELKRQRALSEMSSAARAMLRESSISIGDTLLSKLVTEDADSTKANVDEFVTLYNEAVGAGVKEALKGTAPKVGEKSTLTKDQILKIANRAERQRQINAHIELFK